MRSIARSWAAALLVAGAAAPLTSAQTIDVRGFYRCGFDDGTGESGWKVNAPTTLGDFFSVDFDRECAGTKVVALCVDTFETGTVAKNGRLGIYPDDLTISPSGDTPDLGSPLAEMLCPTGLNGASSCSGGIGYDIADVALGSTGVHAAYVQAPGDSVLWLCADSNGPVAGRSYFTTNSYATPAIPFTVNWMIGLCSVPRSGQFFVNGEKDATIIEGEDIVLDLWGNFSKTGERFLVCYKALGRSFWLPVAGRTGDGSGVPWIGRLGPFVYPCGYGVPLPLTIDFTAVWEDTCDVKPSGRPRLRLSDAARLTIETDPTLCGCLDPCFGVKDEGILGATIWKVQNPAGSLDFFNVNHGTAPKIPVTITGVEAMTWEFCGATQCWQDVGVYAGDNPVDPSGNTPGTPLAQIGCRKAVIPAYASDWAYPATYYDTPDLETNTTIVYHGAVQWKSGDTCVWIGSDTCDCHGGPYSDCSKLPSDSSFFTLDGYATPAILFSSANWQIKLDWIQK